MSRVDAELFVLVSRWPDLPDSIRRGIADLVNEVARLNQLIKRLPKERLNVTL